MAATMSNDQATQEGSDNKVTACVIWLTLSGLLGVLAVILVNIACAKWIERDSLRLSHERMIEQMEQIRDGKMDCLIQPDPRFIDELLADATCTARIAEIDLGGDIADERLGRLRKLPNLKCIVFLFADRPDTFLERLQGMPSLENLVFERTCPTRRGIETIGSLPGLKSLTLAVSPGTIDDFSVIKNQPSIENLTLTHIGCDDRVLPILQSLPRLRSVTIEDAEQDAQTFEESLRKALPNCQCVVRESGR